MKINVLIASCDPSTLDNIIQTFNLCQFRCKLEKTDSGKQCIEIIKNSYPDVVILDKVSDSNSYDVLQQIRAFSKVPIFFLSYIADENEKVKALEIGADEYMIKPIRQLEFMAYLRVLLRKKDSLT